VSAPIHSLQRSSVLVALAFAAPASFAACGGGGASEAIVAPTPSPSPTRVPTPTPTPTPAPASGVVITVPTAAPVLCAPSPLVVAVGQSAVLVCAAQGYAGTFVPSVADASVAAVQPYNAESDTSFSVTGLRAGSTTIVLRTRPGGTGSVTVTVSP